MLGQTAPKRVEVVPDDNSGNVSITKEIQWMSPRIVPDPIIKWRNVAKRNVPIGPIGRNGLNVLYLVEVDPRAECVNVSSL